MSQDPGSADRGSRWLSRAALTFVALAAVAGWGASFVGLHEYGMESMAGFTYWSAWLVPATFDGAAFACTLVTYRSSIKGRSALRGRLLMWAFTAVSSWINWIHQVAPEARVVAAGLPIAAVAVFDVVLLELRADHEARHGKRGFRLRPGLLLLRWLVDRAGTNHAFRKQITDISVDEIAGLGPPRPQSAPQPAPTGSGIPAGTGRTPRTTTATRQPAPATFAVTDVVPDETTHTPAHRPVSADIATPARPAPQPAARREEPRVAHTPDPGPAEPPLAEEDHPVPDEYGEQLMTLPAVPGSGMSEEDKRAAARRDYRVSLEADQPVSGAQLAGRYGMSERWGREQVAAAREEMQYEQHPQLVTADSER